MFLRRRLGTKRRSRNTLMSQVKRCVRASSIPLLAGRPLVSLVDRAKAEARPEDDGDQALMRGFKPHVRLFVRGCLGLEAGVDQGKIPGSAT